MTATPEPVGGIDERDRDAVRRRYVRERDKRLRVEGPDQYVEVTGDLGHYVEDPYTPAVSRDPLFDEVTVAFIGGGFAGLVTGARLKQAGIDDVRIIEKGGDFGGTWYWNRYPGAQCDTHSFVYMPLLEETGHVPSEKYAHAPEILEHCRRIGEHFDLYDDACLSTTVLDLQWSEDLCRWVIRTDRGDEMRARFVVMGTGPLHRPKLPGIPGLDTFRGHSFHTSRWDYDYTGGDPAGAPMDELADKRVGVIGTGATSVQCVPQLARTCDELYVFQRTPSSVDVRNNESIDVDWFAAEVDAPRWQEEWLRNFATLQTGGFAERDLVQDGWTDIARRVRDKTLSAPDPDLSPGGIARAFEDSDFETMADIRARIDHIVEDPDTAAALKPWYRQFCKRPCFHDEYLHAFNRPGVHLVDTDGRGVDRIDEAGVIVAGTHYPLDCVIYATGFETSTDYTRRSGFDVIGRDGRKLSDHWADGMRTLHGIHAHGFPNAFVVGAAQGANLTSNYPHNLSEAARTVAAVIAHAIAHDRDEVEVTAEAEQSWVDLIADGFGLAASALAECTPGYYNNEGQPLGRKARLNAGGYPQGPVAFFDHIDQWRSSGRYEGLQFRSRVRGGPGRPAVEPA